VYATPLQDAFWQQQYAAFFKVIVLWDVIEHVNNPVQVMQQAANLLQVGGRIFIDTPCRDGFYHQFGEWVHTITLGKKQSFLHSMYSSHRFGHKQILSKADMHQLAQKAGMQVISLQLIHELSFPYSFYIKKMTNNNALVKLGVATATIFFKIFPIKNKMMVVLQKHS
jgi:2-polyprenyl-3-methyl-5-hydroxy-6-metoxy-1,4-benzoquinol methylase